MPEEYGKNAISSVVSNVEPFENSVPVESTLIISLNEWHPSTGSPTTIMDLIEGLNF